MSELVPILVPDETDQLKWANLATNCDNLRLRAENLRLHAENLVLLSDAYANQANMIKNEIRERLANGSHNRYEAMIVEGQLQFQLKSGE